MKTYSQSKRFSSCKLTKEDLVNLVNLIKLDFPKTDRSEDFKISSYLEKIRISENDLEKFLDHTELPDSLKRLNLDLIGWDQQRNIDKNVKISFYDNSVRLDVSGNTESWVLGKYSQLTGFLNEKKSIFWFFNTIPGYIFQGVLPLISMVSAVVMVGILIKSGFNTLNILLPITVSLTAFLSLRIAKIPYCEIILKERRSFTDRYSNFINIVIFLGSIATILTLFIYLLGFVINLV